MTYPNAANGVGKLFTAQILLIIAAILGAVSAVVSAAVTINNMGNADNLGAFVSTGLTGLLAVGIIALAFLVIYIIAFIIQLIGLAKAGKDENMIKIAFILTLVNLLLTIVAAVLSSSAPTASSVLRLAVTVIQVLINVLTIMGISNLAGSLGNEKIVRSGKVLIVIVLITQILGAVLNFVAQKALAVAGVMALISLVLMLIGYIMYLIFLSRSKKFLATA